MNWRQSLCVVALSAGLLVPAVAEAKAKAKDYQVTGPVLAIEDNVVTVQKGDEKWEIELGPDAKVEGKLAVGQKVTIYYHMVANRVEKKADGDTKGKDAKKK